MTCPIWGTEAKIGLAEGRDGKYVDSTRAGGKYFITGSAEVMLHDFSEREKAKLTTWIIDQHRLGIFVPETTSTVLKEVKLHRELRVDERAYRLMQVIKLSTPNIGDRFEWLGIPDDQKRRILEPAFAWSESIQFNEFRFIITCLDEENLVRVHEKGGSLQLTANGHLSLLENINIESDQAFIAMWFSDKINNAYHHGIAPAIRDSGFTPLRIDKKEHSNKIDDEIIAEIRKSRFLVADFTCGVLSIEGETHTIPRGGVYYEAGFAQGLGIPVIWCCRKDQISTVHFDTRQYNHIVWETPKELRRALKNRIEAVIGTGPRQA